MLSAGPEVSFRGSSNLPALHRLLTLTKICDCRHVRELQISTGLPYQHSSATVSLVQPKRAAVGIGMSRNGAAEHKTQNRRQLHHDVKRWPRGILQWVAHGVASDRILVGFRALQEILAETTSRDVFLPH